MVKLAILAKDANLNNNSGSVLNCIVKLKGSFL